MLYISKFFLYSEFKCKCEDPYCKYKNIDMVVKIISPKLLSMLDEVREYIGEPMIVTSGLRCPEWNKKIGGKPDSEHLKGLAADIRVESSGKRFNIVIGAMTKGFRRIGVAKGFVHLGIGEDKPQDVLWTY